MAILVNLTIVLTIFLSALNIQIELPPTPDIKPNLSRDGTNFSGFIDVMIPLNISNNSPGRIRDIRISALLSIVSIENFGLFPDTTLVNVSQYLESINPSEIVHVDLNVNVSSWIPILAIVDAYLVLDVDIHLFYNFSLFDFPIHLVTRIQEFWKAPFSP